MGDLHPIVIPPLEHTYKSVKYTCSGEGLYKDGYRYDAHAEKLIPPKTTKASVTPKEIEKKPLAYWKAQCAFRGLNQTGAIADLQLRIREAKKKIQPEIKSVETELNKDFKKKNIAARSDSWASKSVEKKAKTDPNKYLSEAFPKGGSGRPANMDIVVLKIGADERLAIADAAEAMGLESVSVDAPWTTNKNPSPDRWVVIGRTRDAVWNQMRDIEREVVRSKQTFSAEKEKPQQSPKPAAMTKKDAKSTVRPAEGASSSSLNRKVNTTPLSKAKPETKPPASKKAIPRMRSPLRLGHTPRPEGFRPKQTARKSALPAYDTPPGVEKEASASKQSATNSWDVRGSYEIRCRDIEEQWGGHSLTLDIYLEIRNGKRQLYGAFDFNAIEGIMRFERPSRVPKSEMESRQSKKRKQKDLNKDGESPMDTYPRSATDGAGKYSEDIFHLRSDEQPTARRPTWRYRWRGHETGEGEIQVNADRAVRSITFSEKGNALCGYFKCDYVKDCYFEGIKVCSKPRDKRLDPESKWMSHSEAAHGYASRARWGGGGFGGW